MRATALQRIKVCLAITIAIFAVIAGSISYAVVKRQTALREVSRYNTTWAASQALAEVQRLENRVLAFARPGSTVDADEIQLRYEILYNRLSILNGGDMRGLIEADPEQQAFLDQFASTLAAIQPDIDAISSPHAADRILAKLAPLGPKLARFSAAANQFSGAQVTDDQQHLLRLHWTFTGIALGLVACGIAFIGLLFFQNRIVRQAHNDLTSMAEDLLEAKEAAEAASAAKSRFLATMSHELRTPLNAIIGFGEVLYTQAFGPLGQPAYREYAGDILKSGRHMFGLVTDILTMAKLESGHYEISLEPLYIDDAIEQTVRMFAGTEVAQGRDILVTPTDDPPMVEGDERAVRQMLLNLLSNAAKFSEGDHPIRVGCTRDADGAVRITVSDHGIGMTPEQADMVIRPFHQVDSRLSRKYEGAGLGLSIVRGLMDRHGGKLDIDSRPGEGSDISLVFPHEFPQAVAQPLAA